MPLWGGKGPAWDKENPQPVGVSGSVDHQHLMMIRIKMMTMGMRIMQSVAGWLGYGPEHLPHGRRLKLLSVRSWS